MIGRRASRPLHKCNAHSSQQPPRLCPGRRVAVCPQRTLRLSTRGACHPACRFTVKFPSRPSPTRSFDLQIGVRARCPSLVFMILICYQRPGEAALDRGLGHEFSQRGLDPAQVPICTKCGTSMWVIRIEDLSGRNRRTYECPECFHRTVIVIRRQ
jgi:DNA-directed RNA polymerase subunit RPC12/RpoP